MDVTTRTTSTVGVGELCGNIATQKTKGNGDAHKFSKKVTNKMHNTHNEKDKNKKQMNHKTMVKEIQRVID